jgi:hypothetical protein
VTYKVKVWNDGTDDSFNVEVRNALPAGMTFVSATPDDAASNFICQQAGGVITCTGGYLPGTNNGTVAVTERFITVKARAPMEHNLDIVNQAFVDPQNAIAEQSEVNNVSQAANVVKSIVDLQVTMNAGSAGSSGDEGHWTFTAKNTITEANSRAGNVVVVANFSAGSIQIDTNVTTSDAGWVCEVFENPVNQVRCVGNFDADTTSVDFDVHYFQTSDDDIHGFVEIDPEDDTTDGIVGRIVEEDETNNTAQSSG